ncbi:MAG: hypothetical protein AAFY25_12100 [Pseudomonadota bacterium]
MSFLPDAAQRCENYTLDPNTGFKFQYVIAPKDSVTMPGMTALTLNKWALVHGDAVHPGLLKDTKGRVFGALFGTGVDRDGALVTPDRFSRFNAKGRSFEADLEDYLSGIAGRFLLILDSGTKTRIYRDPMGHMPLFYNTKRSIAGSSLYLAINHGLRGNPACAPAREYRLSTAAVFPMGQTSDPDVRLMPGNHVLDLADFTAHRGWPLRNSIRKVTMSKAGPVIDKIATRLRQIVQGWIAADDVVLPLDASAGSRILLAAAGEMRAQIAQIAVLQPGHADDPRTLSLSQMMADATDLPLHALTRIKAAQTFGRARELRHDRKRLFWLRTSSALRVPPEITLGLEALYPAGHLVLNPAGLDALQGGWHAGHPAPKPVRATQAAEIAAALATKPDKPVRDAVSGDYTHWKSSLPKTLQTQVEDFIRIELHEPAQAVASLGMADHLPVSPFSDRTLIDLALKLPLGLRRSAGFAEALITALDPVLAGLPYDAPHLERTAAE